MRARYDCLLVYTLPICQIAPAVPVKPDPKQRQGEAGNHLWLMGAHPLSLSVFELESKELRDVSIDSQIPVGLDTT